MIFNDLIAFYCSLLSRSHEMERNRAALKYCNILCRKNRKDIHYYAIYYVDQKSKSVSITKEEYVMRLTNNIRIGRLNDAIKELNILIRFFEKRIPKYQKLVQKEYEKLSVAASLSGPNRNSIYAEGEHTYRTRRGDMVKSKSEQAIADALYDNGVDYEYESAYWTHSYVPDFIIRDSVGGRTVIWEHFGMMSDRTYVMKTLKKIRYYESIGYRLGENFIATFEMYRKPEDNNQNQSPLLQFDSARAEEIVRRYFTPHVFPCTA